MILINSSFALSVRYYNVNNLGPLAFKNRKVVVNLEINFCPLRFGKLILSLGTDTNQIKKTLDAK